MLFSSLFTRVGSCLRTLTYMINKIFKNRQQNIWGREPSEGLLIFLGLISLLCPLPSSIREYHKPAKPANEGLLWVSAAPLHHDSQSCPKQRQQPHQVWSLDSGSRSCELRTLPWSYIHSLTGLKWSPFANYLPCFSIPPTDFQLGKSGRQSSPSQISITECWVCPQLLFH